MLEEAVEVGTEMAGKIERSSDLVQLRADIARWQLAMGQRMQAEKTLEKLSHTKNKESAMINDLGQQIEKTPRESDLPFKSMFQPAEEAESQELPPQLMPLQKEVDSHVRKHEFTKAKEVLLREKALMEEGPETVGLA